MATHWYRESWRKLYTKVDAEWLGLPVSARGLADELLKYGDEQGRLFQVCKNDSSGTPQALLPDSSPTPPPILRKWIGVEVARRLSAKIGEYKRITADVEALLADTFLVVDDGWVVIRNYIAAQERLSPEARRQRAKRERDKGRDMSRDATVTEPVTDSVTGNGSGHEIVCDSHADPIRSDPSKALKNKHARGRVVDALRTATGVQQGDPHTLLALANSICDYAEIKHEPDLDALVKRIVVAFKQESSQWDAKKPPTPVLLMRHWDNIQARLAEKNDTRNIRLLGDPNDSP